MGRRRANTGLGLGKGGSEGSKEAWEARGGRHMKEEGWMARGRKVKELSPKRTPSKVLDPPVVSIFVRLQRVRKSRTVLIDNPYRQLLSRR